jgi:hypothetical protein
MKAEHRKELQTNVLADSLGRFVKNVKSGTKSSSLIYWILAALVLAVVVGWFIYRGYSSRSRSELWTKLDEAASTANLEKLGSIAEQSRGTKAARTARFQIARIQLEQGLNTLGSEQRRAEALKNIEDARTLYSELIQDTNDAPLLRQEAMMGVAKAEESLIGIPKADAPNEMRGTLAQALKYYESLENATPESFQTKAAKKRADELRNNGTQIESFYTELNKRFIKP